MSDGIRIILDILSQNWSTALTDDTLPRIEKITNSKGTSLATTDVAWVYKPSEVATPRGNTGIDYESRISIDIRSVKSFSPSTYEDHIQKMEDEVIRIIESKRTRPVPDSTWDLLIPVAVTYLDDKNRHIGKRVIDVRLMRTKDTG